MTFNLLHFVDPTIPGLSGRDLAALALELGLVREESQDQEAAITAVAIWRPLGVTW